MDDGKTPIFQFRCLSDYCRMLLAADVKLPAHLNFVDKFGDITEFFEVAAMYAGYMTNEYAFMPSIPDRFRKESWLIYQDPGKDNIGLKHLIQDKGISDILPQCNKKVIFGD